MRINQERLRDMSQEDLTEAVQEILDVLFYDYDDGEYDMQSEFDSGTACDVVNVLCNAGIIVEGPEEGG